MKEEYISMETLEKISKLEKENKYLKQIISDIGALIVEYDTIIGTKEKIYIGKTEYFSKNIKLDLFKLVMGETND